MTPAQREWATFDRPASNLATGSQSSDARIRPTDLSHAERDALGHFATQLREQQIRERRKARMSWYDIRFADLMKVIILRVGGPGHKIPDGLDASDVEDVLMCIGYHFQARFGSNEATTRKALTEWCLENCANWKSGWPGKGDMIQRVLTAIRGRQRDLTAIEAGKALRLTWVERCELGLRTIRPHDMTPVQFEAAAKARDLELGRARQRARRLKKGQPLRSDWLQENSKSRDEPWKHMDPPISRAKFYRLGLHRAGETGPSGLVGTSNSPDGPVSRGPAMACQHMPSPLNLGTSPRLKLSHGRSNGSRSGNGSESTATPNPEDDEPHDALSPVGRPTDKSRLERRTMDMIAAAGAGTSEAAYLSLAKRKGWVEWRGSERILVRGRL